MIDFSAIRQVFLDMDGTIYEGSRLFDCTNPFLAFLRQNHIGYSFLTNNSSYSVKEYVERLQKMGVEAAEENFYTSTLYTIDYLKSRHPEIRKIFLMGMKGIIPEFESAGFEVAENDPDAVVIAFDRDLVYQRLCRTAYLIAGGIPAFATHPDPVCPTDLPTHLVDCGAITKCLEHSTGKSITVLGKPDPGMLREGAKRCGTTPEHVLMIGDRLSTDIAVGCNAKAWTCHISTQSDYSGTAPELRPSVTCKDLAELQKLWERTVS